MFFAGQLKEGNYPWEEDEEGCLISSGLAEKLFGTERIQGNQVQILGKTYIVRGCIKSRDSFAAVFAETEDGLEGISLQYTDHRQPGSLAESLLTQITGSAPDGFWEGNLYSSLARVLAASLLVWGLSWSALAEDTGRQTDVQFLPFAFSSSLWRPLHFVFCLRQGCG